MRLLAARGAADGINAFIFRKERKNDTMHVAVIPAAHYSVVMRTVSSRIRLRG